MPIFSTEASLFLASSAFLVGAVFVACTSTPSSNDVPGPSLDSGSEAAVVATDAATDAGSRPTTDGASTDAEAGGPPSTDYTRIEAEPPSGNCAAGGTAVRFGPDTNGNDTLDDAEIQQTTYVCGPTTGKTLSGDYTIHNSLDADALMGVTRITGNLTIDVTNFADVVIPTVVQVDNSVTIIGTGLQSVSMPALKSIGLALDAQQGGGALTTLSFPELEVAQSIVIATGQPNQLATVSLPKLFATNAIDFEDMAFATFPAPGIRGSMNDALFLARNGFKSLAGLSGVVYALQLHLIANNNLTDFSGLDHAKATHLEVTNLDPTTAPNVTTSSLVSLAGIESAIGHATDIELDFTAMPSLTDISALSGMTAAGTVHFVDYGNLKMISLPKLATAHAITLDSPASPPPSALTTIDLSGLQSVDLSLTVSGEHALTSLQLTKLAKASGLVITNDAALTSLKAPSLVTLNTLDLDSNAGLTSLVMAALTDVKSNFTITNNTALDTCVAKALYNQLITKPMQPMATTISGNLNPNEVCP
jgi:hypothetical protein